MDVPEDKYKRLTSFYRDQLANILNQHPLEMDNVPQARNLSYLLEKQKLQMGLPVEHPVYSQVLEQIQQSLAATGDREKASLGLRLARCLPFPKRIKLLERAENEIVQIAAADGKNREYHYECVADVMELLLSVCRLTFKAEEFYFDINQKVVSITTRIVDSGLSGDANTCRNTFEALRCIMLAFEGETSSNKLIDRLLLLLGLSSSNPGGQAKRIKFQTVFGRLREFQARVRARLIYPFCCLVGFVEENTREVEDMLLGQILRILQSTSQCDINTECMTCIRVLLLRERRVQVLGMVIQRCSQSLLENIYRKEYIEFYFCLLQHARNCNTRLKYAVSVKMIQLGRSIKQQFLRFVVYRMSCRNLLQISHVFKQKGAKGSILLSLFQYSWFINLINESEDMFRSEFLICLLQAFYSCAQSPSQQEVTDLVSLCHRLVDWKIPIHDQTRLPTIKFGFEMYLTFVKKAAQIVGFAIQPHIQELIFHCNQQKLSFLFKFKLVASLLSMGWYQANHNKWQGQKLQLGFLSGELRLFMMPTQPKPFFDYEYSLRSQGQLESRKEIDCIKIVMHTLNLITIVHPEREREVLQIISDYHHYLSSLEQRPNANHDLITCLRVCSADSYMSQCERLFLLSLINQRLCSGRNNDLNLDGNLTVSPYQSFKCSDQTKIFGSMSPIQMSLRVQDSPRRFNSVILIIRRHEWVTLGPLTLTISTGAERKQLPFESCVLQIGFDSSAEIYFQVSQQNFSTNPLQYPTVVGYGRLRLQRHLRWRPCQHLSFLEGISMRIHVAQTIQSDHCYLSYYNGEPIMLQLRKSSNDVVLVTSNAKVWRQLQSVVLSMVDQLLAGTAQIIDIDQE